MAQHWGEAYMWQPPLSQNGLKCTPAPPIKFPLAGMIAVKQFPDSSHTQIWLS